MFKRQHQPSMIFLFTFYLFNAFVNMIFFLFYFFIHIQQKLYSLRRLLCMQLVTSLHPFSQLLGTMHLSPYCTACLTEKCRRHQCALLTVAAWSWRDCVLLSESPSCSSLHHPELEPWPLLPGVDILCATYIHINNGSRPKRPFFSEAPTTQRSGCAHRSESSVRLAARPSTCVW